MTDSGDTIDAIIEAIRQGDFDYALTALDRTVRQTEGPANGIIAGSVFERYPTGQRELYLRLYRTIARGYKQRGADDSAANCYRRAIAIDPDFPANYNNLGNALKRLGRSGAAREAYSEAIRRKPSYAGAYNNLGALLHDLDDLAGALDAYRQAYAHAPEEPAVLGNYYRCLRDACDWKGLGEIEEKLRRLLPELVAKGENTNFSPLQALSMPIPGRLQCAIARERAEAARRDPLPASPAARDERGPHVAYLSADFGQHPVGRLVQDVIRRHDRSVLKVSAFAIGGDPHHPVRRKIAGACDLFHDGTADSDDALAARIRDAGIDILVDLMGHTRGARLGIMARRPAPIQATWLGFAGSTGADWIDYAIVDETVAPARNADHFSEHRAILPRCYLPDGARPELPNAPTRKQAGLPARGFVFCCFNAPPKIDPEVFEVWMRILARVPGSVLWLRYAGETVMDNLRKHASACEIDPNRLVFAGLVRHIDHLARLARAGLFLDTFYCNGHSTVLDALWCGVPTVARRGKTFATRVGASLLHAVGLDELVADSASDYEEIAVATAQDRNRLQRLEGVLKRARRSGPLFDPSHAAACLDAAFLAMWKRHRAGQPPAAIEIAPISI